MQYQTFNALWSHGRHFRVEKIDKKRLTSNCGVMASFSQDSRASVRDLNLINAELYYVGNIINIINILKVNFRIFHFFILDVQWFKVVCRGPQATVRRDASGFFQIDSTKHWTDQSDTFVLPQHCEHVYNYTIVCINIYSIVLIIFY